MSKQFFELRAEGKRWRMFTIIPNAMQPDDFFTVKINSGQLNGTTKTVEEFMKVYNSRIDLLATAGREKFFHDISKDAAKEAFAKWQKRQKSFPIIMSGNR